MHTRTRVQVGLEMTMNGVTRRADDSATPSTELPKVIDVIAIQYPNGRHYTTVGVRPAF